MPDLMRFGVSLERKLVDRFDRLTREMGYFNRSKAIGDALSNFIADKEWNREEGVIVASISFLYNHEIGNVTHVLTETQHEFNKNIISSMHAHLTHEDCIEVLITRGDVSEIKKLADAISSTRGVRNCKATVLG